MTDFVIGGSEDDAGRKTVVIRTQLDQGNAQLTPIRRQYVRLQGPNTGIIDRDQFVLQPDGYYELSVALPLEAADGDYTLDYWFVYDAALNDIYLDGSEVDDAGFPITVNFTEGQVSVVPATILDTDSDGIANFYDTDDDNDGVADDLDAFPTDESETLDSDNDGVGNNTDNDDDNDGVSDGDDAFALDPSETLDTDGDGIGNNRYNDDYVDGVNDVDDSEPLIPAADSDGDGVIDELDDVPNSAANYTDSDGDGVFDYYDSAPNDPAITKAVRFNFGQVSSAGVSESLSGDSAAGKALASALRSVGSAAASEGKQLVGGQVVAQSLLPSNVGDLEVDQRTNLVSWGADGSVLTDVVLSDESMFIAEAVLTPDGKSLYLFTGPDLQRALQGCGQTKITVDQCQLYRVELDNDNAFSCLLDSSDPGVQISTVGVKLRDDFLRRSISFRADGWGVLETGDGPMLLQPNGNYRMFNQTSRVAPDGFVKLVESVAWLDDEHIAIGSSIFPEDGGGVTSYWSAFNIYSGIEVDEI